MMNLKTRRSKIVTSQEQNVLFFSESLQNLVPPKKEKQLPKTNNTGLHPYLSYDAGQVFIFCVGSGSYSNSKQIAVEFRAEPCSSSTDANRGAGACMLPLRRRCVLAREILAGLEEDLASDSC